MGLGCKEAGRREGGREGGKGTCGFTCRCIRSRKKGGGGGWFRFTYM